MPPLAAKITFQGLPEQEIKVPPKTIHKTDSPDVGEAFCRPAGEQMETGGNGALESWKSQAAMLVYTQQGIPSFL